MRSRERRQLVRRRQRAEPLEKSLDEIDLRLRERRVEPDAADARSVAPRGLDDVATRHPGEVRVVEHHLGRTPGEDGFELGRELPERATALVAVEPYEAAFDVLLGYAATCPRRECP